MNDDTEMLPSRRVEIPARFIRQAYEHLQATQERHATLLFIGDGIDGDIICVGVSTRRHLPAGRLIADQRPIIEQRPPETDQPLTFAALTSDMILNVIRQSGPIGTKMIGDTLGIRSNNVPLRQRIYRVVASLLRTKTIRAIGKQGNLKYAVVGDVSHVMPVRVRRMQPKRTITREHITEDKVIEHLKAAGRPTNSLILGDMLRIPRDDTTVRSKISDIMRILIQDNRARITGRAGGYRLFELIPPVAETVTE